MYDNICNIPELDVFWRVGERRSYGFCARIRITVCRVDHMQDEVRLKALQDRVAQLEHVVQECERLSVANRYAAAIMHEVNNPLEALTNIAYLMELEALPPTASSYLDLMKEQIAVLTAVTRPSLAYYKDQRRTKSVDLVHMVESIRKLHEKRMRECGVEFSHLCPESAPCQVVGSEMLQVLSNLVLNAVDAIDTSKQGTNIHIRIRRSGDVVRVIVADNGPGVPEHLEDTLFEAYATTKQHGTGLGLWITRRIVEKHKGSIRARTCRRQGRTGTAFRIVLPCVMVAASAIL